VLVLVGTHGRLGKQSVNNQAISRRRSGSYVKTLDLIVEYVFQLEAYI